MFLGTKESPIFVRTVQDLFFKGRLLFWHSYYSSPHALATGAFSLKKYENFNRKDIFGNVLSIEINVISKKMSF